MKPAKFLSNSLPPTNSQNLSWTLDIDISLLRGNKKIHTKLSYNFRSVHFIYADRRNKWRQRWMYRPAVNDVTHLSTAMGIVNPAHFNAYIATKVTTPVNLQGPPIAAVTNAMNDMVNPDLSDCSWKPMRFYVLTWPSKTLLSFLGYNQLLEKPMLQQLIKSLPKNQKPLTKTDREVQYFLCSFNQIMDFRKLCIPLGNNICSDPVLHLQVAAVTNVMNDMINPGLSECSWIPIRFYVLAWPSKTLLSFLGYNQLLEKPMLQQLIKVY